MLPRTHAGQNIKAVNKTLANIKNIVNKILGMFVIVSTGTL